MIETRCCDREMSRRIMTAIRSASDTEIHEGMAFYHGAHGLCRAFAKIYRTTPRQVAGIYAALSPMNGWETNVANMMDVLRDGNAARVNTSEPNRICADRARRGTAGRAPGPEGAGVLRGHCGPQGPAADPG